MKRAKGFIILATIATLAFGSVAFGADTATAAPAKTEKAAEVAKTYADLTATDVLFQNDRSEFLGVYPSFTGMDDFNTKIAEYVFKAFLDLGATAHDNFTSNNYLVSYEVKNEGRYASVLIDRVYDAGYTNVHDTNAAKTFYIDKETNKEITEAAYKTAMEAAKKPVEPVKETPKEAAKDEPVFVPVADVAKLLGYTVEWDSVTNMVTVAADDFKTTITPGVNKYTVAGEVVALESAPLNIDSRMFVPTTFFSKVLGATLDTSVDGMVTIAKGDKKAEIKILKELPVKEAAKEEAKVEEAAVFVPIRKHAEDLGFTLDMAKYNSDKMIVIKKGDVSVTLTVGMNSYMVGDKAMKLDAAPVIKDGPVYVPLSFFTDILGAESKTLADGTIELSMANK